MKGFFREVKRINWKKTLFGSYKRTVISFALFIPIVIGAIALGFQIYLQNNPAIVYEHKLQTMTDNIGKSVQLPTNETPVVATVTNKNVLPKETFFSYAKNGDKILMYKKHKLAILYRPSLGVVITEATLDFKDVTPTSPVGSAVAGASTSALSKSVPVTVVPDKVVPPTVVPSPIGKSSGTNAYHPQGKILIAPQQ